MLVKAKYKKQKDNMTYIVATFYHFFDFNERAAQRPHLQAMLQALDIRGTLILAPEGINSTLSGTRAAIDSFLAFLKTDIVKAEFDHKESVFDAHPFKRAKVRLKKETISFGEPAPLQKVGHYVEAQDWNAIIDDPDTVLIDARNDYELHLGTFKNAIDPNIKTFRQLPAVLRALSPAKTKRIATFCTGGIRCEKFTAWLIAEGYENVCHLKGGILKYLETTPENESRWNGECYVFDERVAVGHGLKPTTRATLCASCGYSLVNHSIESGEAGEFCQNCKTRASQNASLSA